MLEKVGTEERNGAVSQNYVEAESHFPKKAIFCQEVSAVKKSWLFLSVGLVQSELVRIWAEMPSCFTNTTKMSIRSHKILFLISLGQSNLAWFHVLQMNSECFAVNLAELISKIYFYNI